MTLAVRGSRPRYGAGSPSDRDADSFLLGHDFLSEAWAPRSKRGGGGLSPTGAGERGPRVNANTFTTLPGFPPSKLETGLLVSRAKGWEVCCSFTPKFASAARCLAGRSGFQAALGGGLLEFFSCQSFPHVSPAPPRSGVETALDL